MFKIKSSDYKTYSKFIENLAKKLTNFYYLKLNKPFKVSNNSKTFMKNQMTQSFLKIIFKAD